MEKGKTKFLVFTSLAHFLNDGTLLLFSLLIVYYSEFYHVNIAFLGTVAASYGLLSGLVSPLISHFADRRDIDVPLIAFGLALEGISVAFFGLAFAFTSEIYIFILIGAILLGFAQAFYHPLGSAILSYTFGKNSPTALGINGSLGSIGRSVMPSIITLLIIAFGESTGMFFEALIMLIGSLIVYLGLSQFRRLTYEGGESGTVKVKEKLDPKYVKFLFMLGTIIFIRSMFISGTTTFLGEYIYKIYDSKTLVGLFLTLSFIGAVFGQPFFGWLTTKKGGRYTVFLTTIVSTAIFFVFLLWNNFIFSVSMYFLETFFALSGFPVLLGYVTQIFPPRYTATASAYIWGISNMIGGAAGVEVMTMLIGTGIGIQIDFWIILLFGVASSVMLPLIPKKI